MTKFGPRYGKRIRKLTENIEKRSHSRYKCPSCSRTAVMRSSPGIWECRKCGAKYASDSYDFTE